MPTTTPMTSDAGSVFADLAPTFDRLRAAVKVVLDTRPKAAAGARACAREFGFDKSIGWKVFQIGYSTDFVTALSAMPGARGWEIVLAKFTLARASGAAVDEVAAALAAFERQLADRRIDRSMLSGMAAAVVDTDESRRQMLRLRKQASDAMAVIHGVHASARVGTYLVTPSKTAGMADLAALTLVEGLERRRPGPAWPLFFPIFHFDAEGTSRPPQGEPLVRSPRAPMVGDLGSVGILDTEIAPSDTKPGAFCFVGRSATRTEPLTVCFGEHDTAVGPLVKQGAEKVCEFSMPVTVPTSVGVLDVLLHRDVRRSSPVRAELYASGIVARSSRSVRDKLRLSLEAVVTQPASLHLSDVAAGTNATYGELCRRAADRLGCAISDFEIHRVVVPHPPVPCTITMWWELAE